MPQISKPKRKRLTLGQQVEIVRQLQNGDNAAQIMTVFGIGRRTVNKIKSNSESILQQAQNGRQSLDSKSSRPCQFPAIEKGLYEFVTNARAQKVHLTRTVLRTQAEILRDSAIQSCSDDTEQKKLESFTVSKGWLTNFIKRNSLRTLLLSGEDDSGSAQEVANSTAEHDAAQAMLSIEPNIERMEIDRHDDNDIENECPSPKPLPSSEVISDQLDKLEEIASDSKVSDAIYHLRKLRDVFSEAKKDEMTCSKRQLLNTDGDVQ